MELNDREHATVLAALRYYQMGLQRGWTGSVDVIATDCDSLVPLTVEEIDALCERVNLGGEP